MIHPMGLPGRRKAMRSPTVGKVSENTNTIIPTAICEPVAECRTLTAVSRMMPRVLAVMVRAQSDQASKPVLSPIRSRWEDVAGRGSECDWAMRG